MPGTADVRGPLLKTRRAVRPFVFVALAALAALAIGVWFTWSKTITLQVDGQARTVKTTASTVGGVLRAAGLAAGPHDIVAPDVDAKVGNHATVSLERGRPVDLTIDGQQRRVWLTAHSVGEALAQLGLRGSDLVLSASRSRSIPVDGMALDVRSPRTVTLVADGVTRPVTSAAADVSGFLGAAGVVLGPLDTVTPALGDRPEDGSQIVVVRRQQTQVVETAPVAHGTTKKQDPAAPAGSSRVEDPGADGVMTRVFAVTTTDGAVTSKDLVSETVTTPPRDAVVVEGTRAAAPPATQAPATTTKAPAAATSGGGGAAPGGTGALNWAGLAACESGGNPSAVSAGGLYRGLYQFSMSTWASVGGSGDPAAASPAEQTYRAQLLYQRSGRGPWPVCGRFL